MNGDTEPNDNPEDLLELHWDQLYIDPVPDDEQDCAMFLALWGSHKWLQFGDSAEATPVLTKVEVIDLTAVKNGKLIPVDTVIPETPVYFLLEYWLTEAAAYINANDAYMDLLRCLNWRHAFGPLLITDGLLWSAAMEEAWVEQDGAGVKRCATMWLGRRCHLHLTQKDQQLIHQAIKTFVKLI